MNAPLSFTLATAIAGYLIGGFPTGVVLSRRKYGIDVRELGSGNIGATNITRVFGWYAGTLTFLIDTAKGALPMLLLQKYWPNSPWLLTLMAAFLVLGHCYSPYLRLRGGKGVATSLGCIAVVEPWAALLCAAVYGGILAITRISAVGSLAGIAAAVGYTLCSDMPRPFSTLVFAIALIVLVRHRSNILRLIRERK